MKKLLFLVMILMTASFCWASDAQPPAGVRVIEAPDVKVGDSWTYNFKEGQSLRLAQEDGRRIYRVDDVNDKEIILAGSRGEGGAWSKSITDRQLNRIGHPERGEHQFREYTPNDARFSFPLWEGKKWKAKYKVKTAIWEADYEVKGRVAGWEKITVPAGTFDALKIVNKIDWNGQRTDQFRNLSGESTYTLWYVPEIKNFVKLTRESLEGRAEWDSTRRQQWGWTSGRISELMEYKFK